MLLHYRRSVYLQAKVGRQPDSDLDGPRKHKTMKWHSALAKAHL